MANITFFSAEWNPDGFVILWPTPDWKSPYTRRVTKTATLGGGVYINDLGFSEADRDFQFSFPNPDPDTIQKLIELEKVSSSILLATNEGLFSGVIDQISPGTVPKVRFRVSSKISD